MALAYTDTVTDAEVAMARLAGFTRCPGIKHKPGPAHDEPKVHCLICQDAGVVSVVGKSTDTVRFWIAWAGRMDLHYG